VAGNGPGHRRVRADLRAGAANPTPTQLINGFRLAFLAAALVALLGALLTLLLVPKEPRWPPSTLSQTNSGTRPSV
jgi:hypothetical protein